jgi:phosphate transport system substrate-binding protein
LALALTAAACGGADAPGGGSGTALSGSIAISGSSTVEPITSLVAEKFRSENPEVSISVNGPGTTGGLALFCKGEIPIADASRPIEAEEADACKKSGIEFVELKVGIDGLTILTSPENTAVECLDFKDLYALLGPESEGFSSWSDANGLAEEIGAGNAPYPDQPLVITGPGEESGTWGSLIDLALGDVGEERGFDDVVTRPDYTATPNDNVIIEGVQGSPSSLGWVGFAYYQQSGGATRAIPIDGGDGNCVEPSTESIENGTYALSRDLFIYVNAQAAEEDAAVGAFVDFYLSDAGLASVAEVGYVDQPDADVAATQETWQSRDTGSATS